MAAAHMMEDLPNAIHDSYPIDKSEYDAVFDDIVKCVETSRKLRKLHHISCGAWADILRQFKDSLPIPVRRDALARIMLALGAAVAFIPPVLNPGVKQMRGLAWKIALAKVELSRRSDS